MNGTESSRNGKHTWWLIGLMTTFILGMVTKAFSDVQTTGNRVAVLESEMHFIRQRLDRIDEKLDKLLADTNPHPNRRTP